jgi:hypothetical protein
MSGLARRCGTPTRRPPRYNYLLAAAQLGRYLGEYSPRAGRGRRRRPGAVLRRALVAHLRVGSRQLIGWAVFFTVAVAALAVNLRVIAVPSREPFAPPGTTNRAWMGAASPGM